MATSPEAVRSDLVVITAAAQDDVRAVAGAAGEDPATIRAALFAATPLIVGEYAEGAAALGLDWFEDVRGSAGVTSSFTPTPRVNLADDDLAAMVAATTEPLYDVIREAEQEVRRAFEESLAELEAAIQKEVAAGFWETVTGNADDDPDAVGWQRFARPDGCKFCKLLAHKGAVYDETSVRFAAHTSCHCVVGPAYDPDAPRAGVMQYVASKRTRTDAERAALREYLNKNFPDAPG